MTTASAQQPQPVASDLKFNLSIDQINALVEQILDRTKTTYDRITSIEHADCTWDSVIVPMAQLENWSIGAEAGCTFMMEVHPDKAVRDASAEASKKLEEFGIEMGMREDLYLAVRAASEKLPSTLNSEDKRLVSHMLRDYERKGLALPADGREQLKVLQKRLADVCLQFNRNKSEDKTHLVLTREELDGMPESYFASLTTVADEESGATKYKVTMDYPDRLPAMKKARNEDTRRRLETAVQTVCPDNVALMSEAVRIRAQAAKLLGFENHSAFRLDINMAKTPAAVNEFLGDLRQKLVRADEQERAALLRLKQEDKKAQGLPCDDILQCWDFAYYYNMLVEKEYSIDNEEIRQYFPLGHVTQAMLDLYARLLGVTFTTVNDAEVWHEDVTCYAVHDSDSKEHFGHFCLDLHPREGKYKRYACFDFRPSFCAGGETYQKPVTAMVANFSKPTADAPSLLQHSEMETYFHELGHVMHQLLAKTKYARFHGTKVARDFVEAPSQMLENWCWQKPTLRQFSSHHTTGAPMPDDLMDKLIKTRNVCAGMLTLRQLFFCVFDMTIHTVNDADVDIDMVALWNSLRKDVTGLDNPPNTFSLATFSHVMSDYDSQYYSYLWSQVFSADMFDSRFLAEGIENAKVGREYREKVLLPGGSKDEMELLVDFLGRKPTSDAFSKNLGIAV
ncbi:metalloendopeptidase [Sorochytrium milnesiophthora]